MKRLALILLTSLAFLVALSYLFFALAIALEFWFPFTMSLLALAGAFFLALAIRAAFKGI